MKALLISTYALGHQPFGIASSARWLAEETGAQVACIDFAVEKLTEENQEKITSAQLIAFYVPMHTATRMAAKFLPKIQKINPAAHVCFFGLYAPVNEAYLRQIGGQTILGGEFEPGLVSLVRRLSVQQSGLVVSQVEPVISIEKMQFKTPDRSMLPALDRYAWMETSNGQRRTVGYTEASRGCKHLCRHCPVVPIYGGNFRIVQREVVLDDIRQQIDNGAEHITFGDPDFFNGPGHAMSIVRAIHKSNPNVTYDVTIKIEHVLRNQKLLAELRETGCLFITSAVEAVDDEILKILDKNHTKGDFIQSVGLLRNVGLEFNPTFVTFTPWHTPRVYLELLGLLRELEMIDNVAPIQYAIRLLIPAGSRLLELEATQEVIGKFDESALSFYWKHPNPIMDHLYDQVRRVITLGLSEGSSRRAIFKRIGGLAATAAESSAVAEIDESVPERTPPHLSEPWFCCAEPTDEQIGVL